jgi:hypothetical protein
MAEHSRVTIHRVRCYWGRLAGLLTLMHHYHRLQLSSLTRTSPPSSRPLHTSHRMHSSNHHLHISPPLFTRAFSNLFRAILDKFMDTKAKWMQAQAQAVETERRTGACVLATKQVRPWREASPCPFSFIIQFNPHPPFRGLGSHYGCRMITACGMLQEELNLALSELAASRARAAFLGDVTWRCEIPLSLALVGM